MLQLSVFFDTGIGASRVLAPTRVVTLAVISVFGVMPREGGAPSNHRTVRGYWVARLRGR